MMPFQIARAAMHYRSRRLAPRRVKKSPIAQPVNARRRLRTSAYFVRGFVRRKSRARSKRKSRPDLTFVLPRLGQRLGFLQVADELPAMFFLIAFERDCQILRHV